MNSLFRIINLVIMGCIYLVSLDVFTTSSPYADLAGLLGPDWPASLVLSVAVVLFLLFFAAEPKVMLTAFYFVCFALFLPALLAHVKIDWVTTIIWPGLEYSFETTLNDSALALRGSLAAAGFLAINYSDTLRDKAADFDKRGITKAEIKKFLAGQGFLFCSILLLSLAISLVLIRTGDRLAGSLARAVWPGLANPAALAALATFLLLAGGILAILEAGGASRRRRDERAQPGEEKATEENSSQGGELPEQPPGS